MGKCLWILLLCCLQVNGSSQSIIDSALIAGTYMNKGDVYTIELNYSKDGETVGSWCPKGHICSGFILQENAGTFFIQHITNLGELANRVRILQADRSSLVLLYPNDLKRVHYKRIE